MGFDLVCRTCLQIKTPETCRKIKEVENNSDVLEMLSYSIPEMNMYLVVEPVICDKCVSLLRTVYRFKSQCLKIEENILRFAQTIGQPRINLVEYWKQKITYIRPKNNNNYKELNTSTVVQKKQKTVCKKEHQNKSKNNNDDFCEGCKGCNVNSLDPVYHLKTNHSPFTCYHCNKKIEKIIDLRRHILGHVKQRKCKICGKGFRDLTVLRRHLWSHTGAKQFACNLCPKKFQQKQCLDQHMLKHQGNDKIKCSYCQKLFSTKYNAKVHMRTMHKKFEPCDLCGKTFISKPELVKHLETNSKSCGNVIKTEFEYDVKDNFIKTEPEFVSVEDNLVGKRSNNDSENRIHMETSETLLNYNDVLKFSDKEEMAEEENVLLIPKEDDADVY